MDSIKRFIDCYVPVTGCTLRCDYCYITMHRLFNAKLPKFNYSPEHVRKALSKERLGGICLINFCAGGETLLAPQIVQYIKELLEEGHYIMVVTNATIDKRFDEIAEFPAELTKRLIFKFSYHYLELKKKGLLERFFNNIRKVRDAGCSFTLEATPSDEWIPYIDEMQQVAIENVGAVCHITIARDERDPDKLPILTSLPREEYKKTWANFESALFNYKLTIFEKKRKEFCYAGDWSFYLNLATGMMTQCYCSYCSQNIFENIEEPIKFKAIGNNCNQHHCYNGHSFIVLGDIPELESPTYAELRNRICTDGSEWLKPEMKHFLSTKLWQSNKEYSVLKKASTNCYIKGKIVKEKLKNALKRVFK